VVQVDSPEELFEHPAHTFVGYFIGSPGMNFLSCEVDGPHAVVDGCRIRLADDTSEGGAQTGGNLQLGIRPEFLKLVFDETPEGIPATVNHVEDLGSSKIATVLMAGHTLRVKLSEEDEVRGELGWLVFPRERSLLYRNSRLVQAK